MPSINLTMIQPKLPNGERLFLINNNSSAFHIVAAKNKDQAIKLFCAGQPWEQLKKAGWTCERM